VAQTLKIESDDGSTYSINLIDTSGWHVMAPGWVPQIALPSLDGDPPPLREVLRLQNNAADQDGAADDIIELHKALAFARNYIRDATQEEAIWLYDQLSQETGQRRCLVRSGKLEQASEQHGVSAMGTVGTLSPFDEPEWDLALERNPYWENPSSISFGGGRFRSIGFDSGSAEFAVGETLTGATSGATGEIAYWYVSSGTFAGGDAAGTIFFYDTDETSAFHGTGAENLNSSINGNNVASTTTTTSGFASTAYYPRYGSDVDGDVPARISPLTIAFDLNGGVDRVWIGVRSIGDVKNFVPIWELEDGTLNASETGIAVDAASDTSGASPGNGYGSYVEVVETDLDWDTSTFLEVLKISMSDITTNEQDNYGLMLWLLRAKVTSGTWEVQFQYGASDSTVDRAFSEGKKVVEISGSDWEIYEMDIQATFLRNLKAISTSIASDQVENDFAIRIMARRTSGTGDLYVDCVCPIPVDEGFLSISDFVASESDLLADVTLKATFSEGPSGETDALMHYETSDPAYGFLNFGQPEWTNFRLPPVDSSTEVALIVSIAETDKQDITSSFGGYTISTDSKFYERWSALRGSE
jgi:hypothetical protein